MKEVSLWGDEYVIPSEKETVKKVLQSTKKAMTEAPAKAIKSKTVPIETKLEIISNNVDQILGHYKEDTIVIKDEDQLIDYVDKALSNKVVALDTETNNSLDPISCKIMGACIYTPGEKNAYIPINHVDFLTGNRLSWQPTEAIIKKHFERLNKINIIMHNAKFDYEVFKCTCGYRPKVYWDTMIAARLLNENERAGLKEQFISKINPEQEKYSIDHLFDIEYALLPPDLFALYAAADPYMTYELQKYQEKEFSKPDNSALYNLFLSVEMPVIEVTAEMELNGVSIDTDFANVLYEKYKTKLAEIDTKIKAELDVYAPKILAWKEQEMKVASQLPEGVKSKIDQLEDPINIASPQQLAILLYDILKVPVVDNEHQRGTGEEILKALKEFPICKLILERRGILKLINTYIEKLPKCISPVDNRLHASFNQLGTDTGRYSSTNPNLQNIPSKNEEIRLMFVPSDGYVFVGSDYSQQEPRILASFANDESMLNAYKEDKDMYAIIASQVYHNKYEDNLECYPDGSIFEEGKHRRKTCKALLLGIMYGMSASSLAERINTSVEEAQKIVNNFYKGFPKVKQWFDKTESDARVTGYVEDMWGRRRRLPDLRIPDFTISVKGSGDFNPILGTTGAFSGKDTKVMGEWRAKMAKCKSKSAVAEAIKAAKKEGITIQDNRSFLSRSLRQCVNARIQGSAATMTKKAMVAVYNDEQLQKLGFKLVIPVHDELIGECPKENAKAAADRLSELMIEVAKDKCKTPMKCDAGITNRWYETDYISMLKKECEELEELKKLSHEEAVNKIRKDFPESKIFNLEKILGVK